MVKKLTESNEHKANESTKRQLEEQKKSVYETSFENQNM